MLNYTHKPAYKLECRNCPWVGTFYFDQMTPEQCPKCYRPNPKRHSLQTGLGYNHAEHRKAIVNTLVGTTEIEEEV
jgi:hypothetical protein